MTRFQGFQPLTNLFFEVPCRTIEPPKKANKQPTRAIIQPFCVKLANPTRIKIKATNVIIAPIIAPSTGDRYSTQRIVDRGWVIFKVIKERLEIGSNLANLYL